MNYVFEIGRQRGAPVITGRYVPTLKNGMARDFYLRFGFQMASETDSADTHWVLPVKEYGPQSTFLARLS
jgi:predicted enzyme involved in methoxymalonyl-ACP biosynthesis